MVSAIPGRISFVPNRVRNPSACAPHRCRAWERSWSAASRSRPWPPPSEAICGSSSNGAMFATSSKREQHPAGRAGRWRGPGRWRGGSPPAARTRSARRRPAPRRARGCRRCRAERTNSVGVEVRVPRGGERGFAGVGLQRVGGGGEDRGALPLLGVKQPEQVRERQPRAALILQQDPGLVEVVAHHPVHHRAPCHGRGPRRRAASAPAAPARGLAQCDRSVVPAPMFAGHRPGDQQRPVPRSPSLRPVTSAARSPAAGGRRAPVGSNTHSLAARRARASRVARNTSGLVEVDDHRPGVRQQRWDDHRAGLARPRRAQQQHRPFAAGEPRLHRSVDARGTRRRRRCHARVAHRLQRISGALGRARVAVALATAERLADEPARPVQEQRAARSQQGSPTSRSRAAIAVSCLAGPRMTRDRERSDHRRSQLSQHPCATRHVCCAGHPDAVDPTIHASMVHRLAPGSGREHFLDPRTQKPPRPPQPARRDLPTPRQVVHGRDGEMQQLRDLRGGHHLIPRQAPSRAAAERGALLIWGAVSAMPNNDAPDAGTAQPQLRDVFKDVSTLGHLRTTSAPTLQKPCTERGFRRGLKHGCGRDGEREPQKRAANTPG